jgi:hypothetical protein
MMSCVVWCGGVLFFVVVLNGLVLCCVVLCCLVSYLIVSCLNFLHGCLLLSCGCLVLWWGYNVFS